MKMDLKNALVIALLILTLFFAYSWIISDGGSGENVKEMERKIGELSLEKISTDSRIDSLNKELCKSKVAESTLKSDILRLRSERSAAEERAESSKRNLDRLNKELAETRRKIEEFKKNPPNRTGDDLINSIKIKTKK